MRASELTHGEARDVADYLNSVNIVDECEMLSALVNAMNRIAVLEERIGMVESIARKAGETAACLKHGIKPD